MNLLYLIGPPGAGKSTLMRTLTEGCDRVERTAPLAHQILLNQDGTPVAIELGRHRDGFPGTDTLPLNVAPTAERWITDRPHPLILGEGDRLAYPRFLATAAAAGYAVTVGYLTAHGTVLDRRCAERGSRQNESWRRGRATKAERLAEHVANAGYRLIAVITAYDTPAGAAAHLRRHLPALDGLPQ